MHGGRAVGLASASAQRTVADVMAGCTAAALDMTTLRLPDAQILIAPVYSAMQIDAVAGSTGFGWTCSEDAAER